MSGAFDYDDPPPPQGSFEGWIARHVGLVFIAATVLGFAMFCFWRRWEHGAQNIEIR